MSDRASQPACFASLPKEIIDAAVAWAVKLDYGQPTPKVRHDFERWLCADPLHPVAWQRVGSLKQNFAGVPPTLWQFFAEK